jgi:hypothetical protein
MLMLKPMLCQDLVVNGILENNGLDGDKVTAAYGKAIGEALRKLMARKFVSERKAT